MNLFRVVLRLKSQEPDIAFSNDEQSRAMCCKCRYWSGRVGNAPSDLVCAVNVPRPIEEELDRVSYRPAYALHDCPDFDLKP